MSGRSGGVDGAAASNAANQSRPAQGAMNETDQRADEEDEREGDASDEERPGQDGSLSGFVSPQGSGGLGGAKSRRGGAARGTAPSRAARPIGGIDPQRWGRGNKDESAAPKRKRKEKARQELTSRLAASLSASSQIGRQLDSTQAAESVEMDDREWDSAGGSVSGGDSEDGGQGVKARTGPRGKPHRVAQLDPPQPKDDALRAAISSRMSARPNWQRQGGFASLNASCRKSCRA